MKEKIFFNDDYSQVNYVCLCQVANRKKVHKLQKKSLIFLVSFFSGLSALGIYIFLTFCGQLGLGIVFFLVLLFSLTIMPSIDKITMNLMINHHIDRRKTK